MITYRTSTFCCTGECVEVGLHGDGSAVVRDTKDPARAIAQECSAQAWTAFLAGAVAGEFDLPT